jgi:4-azaleucine resistance transporter AzlC
MAGVRAIGPLILGCIPAGVVFGALAESSGLSFGAAMAMSALVFAGSAQFIALGLVAAGTPLPIIVATTFLVNLRHLLYAASLLPHVGRLGRVWQLLLGFWLSDEAFAVAIGRYAEPDLVAHKHWFFLGAAATMYVNWQLCTLVGLSAGALVGDPAAWGLDFAMAVTFLGILLSLVKRGPAVAAALVAGFMAVLAHGLPHKLGLSLAAVAGIAAGLLARRMPVRRGAMS